MKYAILVGGFALRALAFVAVTVNFLAYCWSMLK